MPGGLAVYKGEAMYMHGKRITPEQGKVYRNKGGGENV